jgi:beta-lactamase superfamily II metal-dependent hydrolase
LFEVDYLWVGDGEKTGDAIACRLTRSDTGTVAVIVIDGGFTETGNRMVEHIRNVYGTEKIDLVVSTHPDDDHIRGLFPVLTDLQVGTLLVHQPSLYGYGPNDDVKADLADDLVALAKARGVSVVAPFAGQRYFGGAVTVAGPSEEYYKSLLGDEKSFNSVTQQAIRMLRKAVAGTTRMLQTLAGDPGESLVDDRGGTTPRNNTSVILDITVAENRVLFTGDAGVPALTAAADYLDAVGLSSRGPNLFDVPHHGSRHNVDPAILDRLLGEQTTEGRGWAVASVGKEASEHPRPEVANALRRRGYPVACTRGTNIWWYTDPPTRDGYTLAEPLGWLDEGTP